MTSTFARLAVAAIAAALLAGALSIATPGTAHAADNRPCATKAELRAIADGWTRKRTQRKIDANGRRYVSARLWENREFRRCGGKRIGVLFVRKSAKAPWRVQCESGRSGDRCYWRQ